jgi:hypothetical protein
MTTERARVRRELDAVLKTFFLRASAGATLWAREVHCAGTRRHPGSWTGTRAMKIKYVTTGARRASDDDDTRHVSTARRL